MSTLDPHPDCDQHPEQPCACDCMRLAGSRYLNDGEPLPDHVGVQAMRQSCAAWIGELKAAFGSDPLPVVMPVGTGRFTEPVQPWDWPVPIHNSPYRVVLVFRQWVEEEPDEQLARLFGEVDQWRQALDEGRLLRDPTDTRLRQLLLAHCLPSTPGTVRYLKGCVENPLTPGVAGPTRGVLISTLILESPLAGAHDEVISVINADSLWTTDALRRRASRTVAEHTRWWGSLPHSSLPDLDLRRLNRRVPDELTEDLLLYRRGELTREEVETRAVVRARELLGSRWDPTEKRRTLRRVGQRIREAERGDLR